MKFGSRTMFVDFESEFVSVLDRWKEAIVREGLKERLKKIIQEDLKRLEGKK